MDIKPEYCVTHTIIVLITFIITDYTTLYHHIIASAYTHKKEKKTQITVTLFECD